MPTLANARSRRDGAEMVASYRSAHESRVVSKAAVARESGVHDVCVIGAGPVGLTVALECAAQGLRVALVDAGSGNADPPASDASAAEIVDPHRHVPMHLAVRRGLGGTSWLWGGRCVPFDPIDFEPRDFVPESGWPIGYADVQPWYEAASRTLDCGCVQPPDTLPDTERLEYFAKEAKRALVLKDLVEAAPLIDLVLGTVVTDLEIDGPAINGLITASGRPLTANAYVLACGGLETTRLLLSAQRLRAELFGGPDGALGRYYAGHFEGTIANVVFESPETIGHFDYHLGPDGAYRRRVMTIPDTIQRAARLQNIVFWPDNLPFCDPGSKSGIKSFIYLLASTPRIGPRLLSEAIRLGIVGQGPRRYVEHAMNIVRAPLRTAHDVIDVIRDRFVSKRRRPGWLMGTPDDTYVLHYRAEQRPNRESRLTLSDETDTFGMPRLRIDLRYTEEDARTALEAHARLDKTLRANGIGRLVYLHPEGKRLAQILDQASDGYHQTGTTRMGVAPATSVVDADCAVHGLSNLFVASCSVFPTSGHANPTLLATALAARLAAHIARRAVASGVREPAEVA